MTYMRYLVVRSVHQRRLEKSPLPTSCQQNNSSVDITSATASTLPLNVPPLNAAARRSSSRSRSRNNYHLATNYNIIAGANLELDNRKYKANHQVNGLVGELRGVEMAEVEIEDDYILSSSLPGSPRKYHGAKRQTAVEIIERRKKRNLKYKNQTSNETSPTDVAWAAKELEKKEKKRLGLERREKCYMCHITFPKGTMQCAVIEKCIHKWRMKHKAVRSIKLKIRKSIQSLGDGGAAVVFRFAVKLNATPTISKKGMSFVHAARKKFLKIGKVEATTTANKTKSAAPHRPSEKVAKFHRREGIKSPLKSRSRRATTTAASKYNTTSTAAVDAEQQDSSSSDTRKTTSDLCHSTPFKRAGKMKFLLNYFFLLTIIYLLNFFFKKLTHLLHSNISNIYIISSFFFLFFFLLFFFFFSAPGAFTYDQFFYAMESMFGLVVLDETIKEKLLEWLDRDRGGDLRYRIYF